MTKSLALLLAVSSARAAAAPAAPPDYSIQAVRYASALKFPVAELVIGAPEGETIDIAMVIWLIRGGGRNILFDSGFHRESLVQEVSHRRLSSSGRSRGARRRQARGRDRHRVSHAHWDHMGGIDLFPKATVWIQKQEFAYYTGDAWQPGGRTAASTPRTSRPSCR